MRRKQGFRSLAALVLACIVVFPASAQQAPAKEYRIFLLADAIQPKTTELFDGFKTTMNAYLATIGAKAVYTIFDTKSDPANVPGIIKAIQDGNPDLICNYNKGNAFTDNNIAKKLTDPKYRFVSLSAIPVEMGIIKDLKKPGGNITGVGVFLQFNSPMRLMKAINPNAKKLVFYTWAAMSQMADWFEKEVRKACKEEGIELVEFRRIANLEEELQTYLDYDSKGGEYFIMTGISAYVHRDGSPANAGADVPLFIQKKIKTLQLIAGEESVLAASHLAGPCIIWSDIGAQLADKGILILKGKNPGNIPWDYPRKFNIMVNLQTAKDKGITIPQNIISAAYRVYTDYDGTYVQGK